MGLTKPLLISLGLIFLISFIGILLIKIDYRSCEKFEFNLFQNKLVCEGVRGTEIDGQGNIITHGTYKRMEYSITGLYLLEFILISVLISTLTFYFSFFGIKHIVSLNDLTWKSWPYWLRGGLIGLILSGILQFIPFFGFLIRAPTNMIIFFTFIPFAGHNRISDDIAALIEVSVSLIFYFLIGAVIGRLIGKNKNKDVNKSNT